MNLLRSLGLMMTLCVGGIIAGCGQIANPNDITTADPSERAGIAYRLLQVTVDSLAERVATAEIKDEERMRLIREKAESLLKFIDPSKVTDAEAWQYADLIRTTQNWNGAVEAYERAVKVAPNWDRKVNDSLRLAQVLANVGRVKEAIERVEFAMTAPDDQLAPVLPATLYEVVPAAQGKGEDPALARLLEKAIACHMRTRVDRNTEAGKAFILARRFHVIKAEAKILELQGKRQSV